MGLQLNGLDGPVTELSITQQNDLHFLYRYPIKINTKPSAAAER
jgi:hypothetical protein